MGLSQNRFQYGLVIKIVAHRNRRADEVSNNVMDQITAPTESATPENVAPTTPSPVPDTVPMEAAPPAPAPPAPIPVVPAAEVTPVPQETPPVVPAPPTPWWQLAAPIRDAVLAFGGAVYLTGYVFVIQQAFRNNVGPVSFSQTQVVTAGLMPAVVAVFCIGYAWLQARVAKHLHKWIEAASTPRHAMRRYAALLCSSVLCLFLAVFLILQNGMKIAGWWQLITLLLAAWGFAASSATALLSRKRLQEGERTSESASARPTDRAIYLYALVALPIAFSYTFMEVYGSLALPNLPWEFGGMRPRIATLDLDAANLSTATKKALLAEPPTKEGVVSSVLLDVMFAADNCVVVRPHGARQATTYRIGMESIKAITWQGYMPPQATHSPTPAVPAP
jgi:hypothetical protein